MLKAVLFDLDGTLLPMDQDLFVKEYFKTLAFRLAPFGYDPQKLISAIWAGTEAMVKNDGSRLNEAVFWDKFMAVIGKDVSGDKDKFDEYYLSDFDKCKAKCGFNAAAKQTVEYIKSRGLTVALATNPIFPSVATEKRIGWAGLSKSDFALVTTYENTCFSKPNLKYYEWILSKLGIAPTDALMVGNDTGEDMIASSLGLSVFLLTDCLINKSNADISLYPHGSFNELNEFLKGIM